jgi:hypothetical protein
VLDAGHALIDQGKVCVWQQTMQMVRAVEGSSQPGILLGSQAISVPSGLQSKYPIQQQQTIPDPSNQHMH